MGKNEKPVKIKPNTLKKIKSVNKTTKKAKIFTGNQVEKLTTFAFDLGKKAGRQVYTPKRKAKIKKNKYYIPVKNVGKGVISMGLDVYEGLEEVRNLI